MKWLFTNRSLVTQLMLLGLIGCALGAVTAWILVAISPVEQELTPSDVAAAMWLGGTVAVGFWAAAARPLLRPLTQARHEEQIARQALSDRTQTVDRLLDFSQEIQGAGKSTQVFESLAFFLRTELGLSGIVIAAHEPDTGLHVKTRWPQDLLTDDNLLTEMDAALCPCLRQNLPRCFKPDSSPLRCAIDQSLRLPSSHPVYCIPLTLGRKMQCVVHMLLPPGKEWLEQLKQLAATYINTACSCLMSLNLLAEAEQRSMTDPLTHLYNRRSLEHLLNREVALAERHSQPLSLVMIDLDRFKQINDAHGHAAGDHMLRAFADCVRITLRKTDLAFRYGGDEFVIALPQTSLAQTQQVVQKLRQAFAAVDFSSAITNLDQNPTLSIGVVERSKNGNVLTLENLLTASDQALYEAKNTSRNCVRVYEPQRAA